jgi:hypothetical protein
VIRFQDRVLSIIKYDRSRPGLVTGHYLSRPGLMNHVYPELVKGGLIGSSGGINGGKR